MYKEIQFLEKKKKKMKGEKLNYEMQSYIK